MAVQQKLRLHDASYITCSEITIYVNCSWLTTLLTTSVSSCWCESFPVTSRSACQQSCHSSSIDCLPLEEIGKKSQHPYPVGTTAWALLLWETHHLLRGRSSAPYQRGQMQGSNFT